MDEADNGPDGLLTQMRQQLLAWHTDPHLQQMYPGGGQTLATLTITGVDGSIAVQVPLSGAHVRNAGAMFAARRWSNQQQVRYTQRMRDMTQVMVQARRDGYDVGELLAAACKSAAEQHHLGALALVLGRPGSWEASVVQQFASVSRVRVDDPQRVEQLAALLYEMAHARDDGGAVLAQAMGAAVDELGSMTAFVGTSRWRALLENLGGQHASTADSWGGANLPHPG